MIGVDTNILTRAYLDDHIEESASAKNCLRTITENKKLFISSYSILEMAWVLKTKKRSRKEIYEAIVDLVDSPGILVGQREIIISALEYYIKGKADFADYMILAEGECYHAPSMLSFDKELVKENRHCKHPDHF